jgi:NAD(P)-dependent dehydrogenase (short-subunit alcohol dehydrogenase family)
LYNRRREAARKRTAAPYGAVTRHAFRGTPLAPQLDMHPNGTLLPGKSVVVTGGATGIGEAICKVFARHGASVVVNGLPGDPVDAVAREIADAGGQAVPVVADVGTMAGAERCVRTAVERFGKLDVMIANAGLMPEEAEVPDFPLARFDELLHSNVRGVYFAVHAALPALQETKGCVIATGSEAGLIGQPGIVAYGATKGWIHAFIRGVAAEQAKYGVRANVVAPGPIDTEMTRPSAGEMSVTSAFLAVKSVPLGRRGTPEEVANVFLFLASDLATYVTGAIYPVDGGATSATALLGLRTQRDAKRPPEGTVALEHQLEGRGTF